MEHNFKGKWITDGEFYQLAPRNVFHRQYEPMDLPCDEHRNCHILFRKEFTLDYLPSECRVYITADDYYKLYINGSFVGQGPAPSYHFAYNYNTVDVTELVREGRNVIAVHTLYQGLINRVWQSGDNRHGLIMDVIADGVTVAFSDESFKTARHTAYRESGEVGYHTQFLEDYDSRAAEVGFENPDYDDSRWERAKLHKTVDITLVPQCTKGLDFERIKPKSITDLEGRLIFDFGSTYVGYLCLMAKGKAGDEITVREGQELNPDGSVRYQLRANCNYEEKWILGDGESTLDWFDYKSFRYAEIIIPEGAEITDVYLLARHYPFELRGQMKPEYREDSRLASIWDLCVNSQRLGVQEVIQDCMEREKGFYVGDGCYTALLHLLLTEDDSMVRKLIDDAFAFYSRYPWLVTCLDCSFMQEIAEFPLMLVYLVLWHYRISGDVEYLEKNYASVVGIVESYRNNYERPDGLLTNLDKWCVVEWPENYRDGYDADITAWVVCTDIHISINAYYIEAVKVVNEIAAILGKSQYRDQKPLVDVFYKTFYDADRHLFRDSINSDHVSIVGNSFAYAFGLFPDGEFPEKFEEMLRQRKISSMSLFCSFLSLMGLVRRGRWDKVKEQLLDEGAWLRIVREGGTTTFEGWGRDTKWNTSLFHLTMSYAAVFMVDKDIDSILK